MGNVGSFGQVVFEVSSKVVRTFDNFTCQRRYSYARHDTISGKPALEFTGQTLKEVGFTMLFLSSLGVDPEEEVEKLAAMGESGEAHLLILGDKVYGYWAIEELDEELKQWLKGGSIHTAVSLKIVESEHEETGPGTDALNRDNAKRAKAD